MLLTTMEMGEVAAVLNFNRDDHEEAEKRFEELAGQVFLDCFTVWGQIFERRPENLKNSYKSACEAAKYRFIFTGEKKLTYEGLNVEQRKNSGSHLKLFSAIEKDLNSESLLDFKYHSEVLVTSFQNGNYTIDYCMSTLRDLVAMFYQIIQNSRLDMWVIVGYDIREYYKQIQDIETFHQWIDSLCEVVLGNIRQKKKNVDMDLKDKLLKLIEENLENDLSLELLADKLSMRLDTLSRSFRQIMGKGYTEYVKERKLARALELMDEDLSMKEVAKRLGYNSPQYFIKIFKETFGETPYQYKKNKKGEENG